MFSLLIHYPTNVCLSVPDEGSNILSRVEPLYVCFRGIWTIEGEGGDGEGSEAHIVDSTAHHSGT